MLKFLCKLSLRFQEYPSRYLVDKIIKKSGKVDLIIASYALGDSIGSIATDTSTTRERIRQYIRKYIRSFVG